MALDIDFCRAVGSVNYLDRCRKQGTWATVDFPQLFQFDFKLLNLALETIEISSNGNVSMMMLTRKMLNETGTHPEDADGLINYARRIEDVKLAALIQEQENGHNGQGDVKQYHVSLRSDGSVDVAVIASGFGGGGHPSAAGFGIQTTLSDLKHKIIQLSETI